MSEQIKRYTVGIAQYGYGPELREERHCKMIFYADHQAAIAPLKARIEELERQLAAERAATLSRYRIVKCWCGGSVLMDGSCDRCDKISSA